MMDQLIMVAGSFLSSPSWLTPRASSYCFAHANECLLSHVIGGVFLTHRFIRHTQTNGLKGIQRESVFFFFYLAVLVFERAVNFFSPKPILNTLRLSIKDFGNKNFIYIKIF